MKRTKRTVAFLLVAALLLGGCGKFEPQHKTEFVTERVDSGMFHQVIEKNVTYVQQTKDGEWEEESSEVVNWSVAEDYNIQGTIWVMSSNSAADLYSGLDDSFKDVPATIYFHFGTDLKDMQTSVTSGDNGASVLNIQLDMTADLIFTTQGKKFCFYDVKVLGADVDMEGATKLKIDYGEGEGIISVPAGVEKYDLNDYLIKQSDTYIETVAFADLPTFDISSDNLEGGVWDPAIANLSSGENMSPELTWEPVDGASQYVVIMIDGGWLHMDVFTTETSLAAGSVGRGERGAQYVGPYPPTGSTHTYTVFVFALKNDMGEVSLMFNNGANSVDIIYSNLDVDADGNTGNVIAYARLDGNYTNKP